MKKAWLLAAIGLLTVVFALGAVACGDDDDNGDDGDPTSVGTTIATPLETDVPAGDETPDAGETPDEGGQPGAFFTLVEYNHPTQGLILTTFDGLALYTFDNDSEGTSTCTDACASMWPPMPAQGEPTGGPGVDGELGTITRDDGSAQITYDGMPLYMYSGDPNPGDVNGDGQGGVWHLVSLD